MWSLRKNLHKTSAIGRIGTPINCDTGLSANGNTGVYIVNAIVGTDIGRVTLTYDAINIPDRFQIIYDGNIVADSKYVGDALGSFNVLGNFTLPQKEFDGFQFINNGQSETFTNTISDVANGSPSEPTDGQGTISFAKSTPTPSNLQIKAYGPVSSTAWSINIGCPVPIPEGDIFFVSSSDSSCESCRTFRAVVPQGTTKRVEVTKTGFNIPYSNSCPSSNLITSDTSFTLQSTQDFNLGLEGDDSNTDENSIITIRIFDNDLNSLEKTIFFDRNHSGSIC